MTNEELISLFNKEVQKALDGIYKDLPKYLRNEMLHPKKKPRGSMRRVRQGRDSE